MLFVGTRAWLRRRVLHALTSQSQVFSFMLDAQVGVLLPLAFRPHVLSSFVRHLLAWDPLKHRQIA
jgi:hypothetical protein